MNEKQEQNLKDFTNLIIDSFKKKPEQEEIDKEERDRKVLKTITIVLFVLSCIGILFSLGGDMFSGRFMYFFRIGFLIIFLLSPIWYFIRQRGQRAKEIFFTIQIILISLFTLYFFYELWIYESYLK